MQINSSDDRSATVTLTLAELRILNNSMNETLEAVDVEEFHTRVGADVGEVSGLLDEVNALIRSLA